MVFLVDGTQTDTGFRGCELSPVPGIEIIRNFLFGDALSDAQRAAVPKKVELGYEPKKPISGIFGMSTPPYFSTPNSKKSWKS